MFFVLFIFIYAHSVARKPNMQFVNEEEFKQKIEEAIVVADATINRFKVHPDHKPLIQAYRDPNFTDMAFLIVQISTLGGRNSGRKQFTLEKIKSAFMAYGHGDIKRFRDDLDEFFKSTRLTHFMTEILYYRLKEFQDVCARCGCRSTNHTHGAFGFECDHVAENFRKKGEASAKTDRLCKISDLMKKILEMAQTQLTCVPCHLNLTSKKTKAIEKMFLF